MADPHGPDIDPPILIRGGTVFDGSGNPMTLIDEALVRVEVNPATCALYGLGREGLVGRRIDGMLLDGRLPDTSPTWDEVVGPGIGTGSESSRCLSPVPAHPGSPLASGQVFAPRG